MGIHLIVCIKVIFLHISQILLQFVPLQHKLHTQLHLKTSMLNLFIAFFHSDLMFCTLTFFFHYYFFSWLTFCIYEPILFPHRSKHMLSVSLESNKQKPTEMQLPRHKPKLITFFHYVLSYQKSIWSFICLSVSKMLHIILWSMIYSCDCSYKAGKGMSLGAQHCLLH